MRGRLTLAVSAGLCVLVLGGAARAQGPGIGIRMQIFENIGGTTVADLTNHADYPDSPTSDQVISEFLYDPVTDPSNYGTRFLGYIYPPATGDYVFWIASDDQSSLLLSTDEDPQNATEIASVAVWTDINNWTTETNQCSTNVVGTITLTGGGGEKYYIEALHKEGSGGDHVAVRWQLSDGSTIEEPIPGHRLDPYYVDPPVLTTIEVTPDLAECTPTAPGNTVDLTVATLDQYGNTFPATVDFTLPATPGGTLDVTTGTTDRTTNPTIPVTFTSDGTEGTFTFTATEQTAGTVSGTADIIVSAPYLAAVNLTPASSTITPDDTQTLTAEPVDQTGNPFTATVDWSVDSGGAVAPPQGLSTVFTPDGTAGTFTVTAVADDGIDTVPNTATVQVLVSGQMRINCGDNGSTPAGWEDDDTYITGGADYNFGVAPDPTGVTNAAPAEVYRTVRHRGTDPGFTLSFPALADGHYTVRLHFFDEYNSGTRAMDITIEGVLVLDDFNIFAEAGDKGALVKDFDVTVSDGDGLQVVGHVGSGDDIFYGGVEIIPLPPPEIDSLVVTPDIAYVRPNETVPLTATALDQYGDPFQAVIAWAVDGGGSMNPLAGETSSFESDGTEGTFEITASSGTFFDTASVYVAAPELTTITVTPETKVIPLDGGSVDLTAEALDQYGDAVEVTITWTIDIAGPTVTPASGTTDAVTGQLVTTFESDGSAEDTFTVTAESGAVSGTATVTVTDQPIVATIDISPASDTMSRDGPPLTYTVLTKDQFGDPISLVDVAFSIDPVGGTFDPTPTTTDTNGIATTDFTPDGTSTGDFTVTASSGGVEVTATLKITGPPELTSIEVTPPTAAIISGESVTLTAQPLDQFGNVYPTQVTWTVSAGGTLSADTGGSTVFTSSTEGTYQVTATAGTDPDTVQDSATITVSPPVLTSVSITPASDTIPTNGTLLFTAEAQDQSGNAMTVGITVTWSVDKGGTVDGGPSPTTTFYADTTEDTFTVTATATDDTDTVTGTATVTVEAPYLYTVKVTPTGREIDVNDSLDFTARTLDQFDAAFTATVDWTVSGGGTVSPKTGTTDATGRHTTTFTSNGSDGEFTVTATATEGVNTESDSTKITVLAELTGLGGGEGCVAGAPGLGLGVLLLLAAALAVARERRRAA